MMRVMCLAEAPQQVSARTILLGAHPPRICIHTILSSKWISPFKTHSNTSFISSSGGGGAHHHSHFIITEMNEDLEMGKEQLWVW